MAGAAAGSLRRCLRPPRSVLSLRWRGPGSSVRGIRTGFFPEDADYIDPEGPLLADRANTRWRYMDDASLSSTVLERSNVGMGMLVLNREKGLDLPTINDMYVRLRNLEVNSFKRFVGLAAAEPGPFCAGLDQLELLLVATCTRFHNNVFPPFGRALLWHSQELAHLVADYRKPVVCHVSGTARNSGAALACLASHCGVHEGSEMVVDACFVGLVPDGGMTCVLGSLDWNLGDFLALTGWALRGADLVYCGLARHWLAPEALPFLELTAEKHLEVSEVDSRALLDEHSLPLPEGMRDSDSLPRRLIPFISEIFGKKCVFGDESITEELKTQAQKMEENREEKQKVVSERLRPMIKEDIMRSMKHAIKRDDPAILFEVENLVFELKKLLSDDKEEVRKLTEVIDNVLRSVWQELEDKAMNNFDNFDNLPQNGPISQESIRDLSQHIDESIQKVKVRHGKLISHRQEEVKEAAERAAQSLLRELQEREQLTDHQHQLIKQWFVGNIASTVERLTFEKLREVLLAVEALKDAAMRETFAKICQRRMDQASPLALCATLKLIKDAKKRLSAGEKSKQTGKLPSAVLMESLKMEMRVLQWLLSKPDAVLGLHKRCMQNLLGVSVEWSNVGEDDKNDLEELLSTGIGNVLDLAICPRADMPLSQHPRLRRYHPDFNAKTGLDHDPAWMAAEAKRWSTNFLAESREVAVRELLGWSTNENKDPAFCGLSRFTRVQSTW